MARGLRGLAAGAALPILLLAVPARGGRMARQAVGLHRDGSIDDPLDPQAGQRTSTAREKLQGLRQSLDGLQKQLQDSSLNVAKLLEGTQDMVRKLCDCNATVPGDLSKDGVQTLLGEVEQKLQATEQVLQAGKNIPVEELIMKKTLMNGVLLEIPPRQNSFSDRVVQLKRGAPPQSLVDPRDSRRQHLSTHFTSIQMSEVAGTAALSFGCSVADMLPGAAGAVAAAASGSVGAALGLASSVQASADLKMRGETMQKDEVDFQLEWVPRAAVAIDFADLELVDAAREELKSLADEDEPLVRKSELAKFIKRYGSHVCSKVTLGGTRRTRAILHTQAAVSSEEAHLALSAAISKDKANEAGGAKGDAPSAGIKTGVSHGTGSLQDLVTIEKATDGGTEGLPTALWAHTLAHSENWAVVDRHIRDCTPIWDFVHREKATFGKDLPKEMFQAWYTGFLGLKEFNRTHHADLKDNFVTEDQVMEWVAAEHDKLGPNLELYEKCNAASWCGGHGDCGPETSGVCKCHEGYSLQEATCVKASWPTLSPVLSGACDVLNAMGTVLSAPEILAVGGIKTAGQIIYGRGDTSALELRREQEGGPPGPDGPGVDPWQQLLRGGEMTMAEAARLEQALASILLSVEDAGTLVDILKASVRGQADLVERLGHQDYRDRLAQDAQDLAAILQLRGAEAYLRSLGPDAGATVQGSKLLNAVVHSEGARQMLSQKLFVLARELADPKYLEKAKGQLKQNTRRIQIILQKLALGWSRQQVATALSGHARKLLASLGRMAGPA